MIRVYTASKLSTAPLWRELNDQWPHVHFHARWLKHNKIGTPDDSCRARRYWKEDELDVKHSDALLVYAHNGEHLRGALVEVGIALASKVPVITVGDHPDYGTWKYHPGVTCVDTLDDACLMLSQMDEKEHNVP